MAPARRPAPIQAIVGEDTYLAEAALEVLKQAALSDTQESVRVLYGDEAKWEDVVSAARAGSLFAASRAVVVRRAELLKYASAPQDDEAAGESFVGKIEKSVLLPPRSKRKDATWSLMEIGDSRLIPGVRHDQCSWLYGYGKTLRMKFAMRKEGDGVRVWRVA